MGPLKRIALALAAAALVLPAPALAKPAPASTSTSRGVVLSVDRSQHAIQVIDSAHVVHLYRVHGRLPALAHGSAIRFQRSGDVLSHVRGTGSSANLAFYGRVLGSGARGLVLRAADGRAVRLSRSQLAGAGRLHRRPRPRVLATVALGVHPAAGATSGSIALNPLSLAPGVTVLVTEATDSFGHVTITVTQPAGG
ncbi:MAG: hypothetical protein ACRDMJ_00470 [Solirubrobacteraceae bacterium]